ncbi:hypothetical protein CG716_05495 [Mycolicibacterium sphagni]|uniref:Uncharacterized protein n=1 Tax=Mycolicibacterium sphagni TaxID=1786 RepID=A0A255DR11_9MYCO|nr:hypothetical protein CG716_05495 [Mycolicibacterium sphagni]
MIRALVVGGTVVILFAALKWWALGAACFAGVLWAYNRMDHDSGEYERVIEARRAAYRREQAATAKRADDQNQAFIAGDLDTGVYGKFPPAV